MADALEFELTDNDRRHLRDLMRSPGYRIITKIQAAYLQDAIDAATQQGMDDPLTNRKALARKWAYVVLAGQMLGRMAAGVQFELDILTGSETRPADSVDLARRRREHQVLGELDPAPLV